MFNCCIIFHRIYLPLNGNSNTLNTNWCEIIVTNTNGKQLYCNSFITDITITAKNVVDIALAGRTRWKIENENNNTLKTKGYHLNHNFGHGKEYLSQTLCTLNILAFLFHTLQEFCDELYIDLRKTLGSREEFFQGIGFISTIINFRSYEAMIDWVLQSRQSEENISLEGFI